MQNLLMVRSRGGTYFIVGQHPETPLGGKSKVTKIEYDYDGAGHYVADVYLRDGHKFEIFDPSETCGFLEE